MGGSGDMAAVTRVRLATADDAAACAAIYAPYVAETAISFEIVPPTVDEMAGRIAKVMAHWPWVVVEVDGVVRGYAYATHGQCAITLAIRPAISSAVGGTISNEIAVSATYGA